MLQLIITKNTPKCNELGSEKINSKLIHVQCALVDCVDNVGPQSIHEWFLPHSSMK